MFCFMCMLEWCCSYNKATHQTNDKHKKQEQDKLQEQKKRERGNQEIIERKGGKGKKFKNEEIDVKIRERKNIDVKNEKEINVKKEKKENEKMKF